MPPSDGEVMIGLVWGLVGERNPGANVCCGDVAPHLLSICSGFTGVVTGLEGI